MRNSGKARKTRGRKIIPKIVENSDIVSLKRNIFRSLKYVIINNVDGFTFRIRQKYHADKFLS